MLDQIRKGLIDRHLTQLTRALHVVPSVQPEPLQKLWKAREFTPLVRKMMGIMHLPIKMTVCYVNREGFEKASAWITIPPNFPFYMSQAFKDLHLTMYIRCSYIAQAPSESFIATVAHELSHVVLASIGHELTLDEEAVDLTGMILGFSDFFYAERVRTPRISLFNRLFQSAREEVREPQMNIGYFNLDEILYAKTILEQIRRKQPR